MKQDYSAQKDHNDYSLRLSDLLQALAIGTFFAASVFAIGHAMLVAQLH